MIGVRCGHHKEVDMKDILQNPKKRWPIFEDYYLTRINKNSHIKCTNCGGKGWVYADYENPDPIEGMKMADTTVCQFCGRTGEYGKIEDVKQEYLIIEEKYNAQCQKLGKLRGQRQTILEKLTKGDITFLDRYGLNIS